MHVCDYVVDFICGADIHFRSCNRCDKENKTRLLLQYDDNFSFTIDICATIPFELLALILMEGRHFFSLRLNRLLRLFRFKRYDVRDFLKDNETIDTSFERVLYLFFFMFICAHYFGCLFYFGAFYVAKTYPKV